MTYFEISFRASSPILSSIVFTSSEKVGDADLSTSFMEISLSSATKRKTSESLDQNLNKESVSLTCQTLLPKEGLACETKIKESI